MATQYYNEPEFLIDRFCANYAAAALLLSEEAEGISVCDLSPELKGKMEAECFEFLVEADAQDLGITEDNVDQAGTDFWLSRNGHGSGFFDREEVFGEHTEALHSLAQQKGGRDLYMGDDNVLYQSPA